MKRFNFVLDGSPDARTVAFNAFCMMERTTFYHYIWANTKERGCGGLKAQHHGSMVSTFTALAYGIPRDDVEMYKFRSGYRYYGSVRGGGEFYRVHSPWWMIHDHTQLLTSHLEMIGFDYHNKNTQDNTTDKMIKDFSEKFFDLACDGVIMWRDGRDEI